MPQGLCSSQRLSPFRAMSGMFNPQQSNKQDFSEPNKYLREDF